jgi:protein-disulfide isomerase
MARFALPLGKRDHIRGKPQAPTTLLEYGDFECPACGRAYPIVKRIEQEADDWLRVVFRNFPLTEIHPHAFSAACAAESAGRQGRFWAMHDMLFENQDRLSDRDLLYYAQRLRLDMQQFVQDFQSDVVAKKVREDFMSGARSGVNGTPTFFINERRYDGPSDYPYLAAAIQQVAREVSHG